MNKTEAELFVSTRIQQIYRQLAAGLDVAPGKRLRLEGQIELLQHQQLITQAWLEEELNRLHQSAFGEVVDPLFWQWQQQQGSPFCLPWRMWDAPVYKA